MRVLLSCDHNGDVIEQYGRPIKKWHIEIYRQLNAYGVWIVEVEYVCDEMPFYAAIDTMEPKINGDESHVNNMLAKLPRALRKIGGVLSAEWRPRDEYHDNDYILLRIDNDKQE